MLGAELFDLPLLVLRLDAQLVSRLLAEILLVHIAFFLQLLDSPGQLLVGLPQLPQLQPRYVQLTFRLRESILHLPIFVLQSLYFLLLLLNEDFKTMNLLLPELFHPTHPLLVVLLELLLQIPHLELVGLLRLHVLRRQRQELLPVFLRLLFEILVRIVLLGDHGDFSVVKAHLLGHIQAAATPHNIDVFAPLASRISRIYLKLILNRCSRFRSTVGKYCCLRLCWHKLALRTRLTDREGHACLLDHRMDWNARLVRQR